MYTLGFTFSELLNGQICFFSKKFGKSLEITTANACLGINLCMAAAENQDKIVSIFCYGKNVLISKVRFSNSCDTVVTILREGSCGSCHAWQHPFSGNITTDLVLPDQCCSNNHDGKQIEKKVQIDLTSGNGKNQT